MPILSSFVSGFQKNITYCFVRQQEMPENAFQERDVITFTCFLGNFTARTEDIALKFCVRVVCVYLDNIYSGFG